ncbi:MAG: hypothetical protein GDA56_21145 [Hormoscilla sp. GM7CHS1pb]|nr:hypothetical protein [Hormoscilla sp. GM7CHS1pb]
MNVQVLAISPTSQFNAYDVKVNISEEQHDFRMTVKIVSVAGREIQVTNGDEKFLETFRFNQMVALEISKLVSKVITMRKLNYQQR